MSGWDNDKDNLDKLFNEDASSLHNTTTSINDSNSNNNYGNGWDDDGLDDFSSLEEDGVGMVVPVENGEMDQSAAVVVGAEVRIGVLLSEHEEIMMRNEIINELQADQEVDAPIVEGQGDDAGDNIDDDNEAVKQAEGEEDEDEDAWDFEDEEDIFNEQNNDDSLDFVEDTTATAVPTTAAPAVVATAKFSSSDDVHCDKDDPSTSPPLPTENDDNFLVLENRKTNPFLQDSDDEEPLRPKLEEPNVILNNDKDEEELDDAIVSNNDDGGDGWSDDDDLFEEEEEEDVDEVLDSSLSPVVPKTASATATAPVAPPPPITSSSTTPAPEGVASHDISPVANRTRSKNTRPDPPPPPPPPTKHLNDQQGKYQLPELQHHQRHHQFQQFQQQQEQPALNPSQQHIHQMLSTYTTNLTNKDYPSQLHSKLHLYQTQSRTSTTTTPAAELRRYYAIRPKLRKYTLGVELDRMEYTLILENGTCTRDKDVIRSYFGVGDDGDVLGGGGEVEMMEEEATVEELLIRSANQSLLADALVALTGSEEDVVVGVDRGCESDDFFDSDDNEDGEKTMGLILAGPTLCMSSVAETCQFTVDLQCGKVEALCDLAISVPFHGDVSTIHELLGDDNDPKVTKIIGDGRIILARARVSVRFRPGGEGGNENDEPTVQYAIQSVNPLLPSNSPVLRHVAIALARDQEDPFFQQEEQRADVGDATDIRDLFLLNQHLLSDSGLLAVSDHLERLRGAAEAKSTGFRSALRQLDGVTNVSGKLQFLKGTANATRGQGSGSGTSSGFLGLGLALPSAEEIEAAEREAQSAVARQDDATFRFPRPNEVQEGIRFPRPDDVNGGLSKLHDDHNARPPPPPPPAPTGHPPQTDITRPKPIIGGLFTGLSRLAAAATQPSDLQIEQDWGEAGGTGLTPPSSPKANLFVPAPTNDFPTLYRREENAKNTFQSTPGQGDGVMDTVQQLPTHLAGQQRGDQEVEFQSKGDVSEDIMMDNTVEDDDDGGWSDDEFDFEDPVNDDVVVDDQKIAHEKELNVIPMPTNSTSHEKEELAHLPQVSSVRTLEADSDMQQNIQSKSSKSCFSEDLSNVLQGKIESENKEMIQSGRLKRWAPLGEDRTLQVKLMEVMRQDLIRS